MVEYRLLLFLTIGQLCGPLKFYMGVNGEILSMRNILTMAREMDENLGFVRLGTTCFVCLIL